jgi:hypothetical protein
MHERHVANYSSRYCSTAVSSIVLVALNTSGLIVWANLVLQGHTPRQILDQAGHRAAIADYVPVLYPREVLREKLEEARRKRQKWEAEEKRLERALGEPNP